MNSFPYRVLLLLIYFVIATEIHQSNVDACSSFYCLNGCGGYKLILANNRDEDIYRPTLPADVWPSEQSATAVNYKKTIDNLKLIECDQSKSSELSYNLCVYGALDTKRDSPPRLYSTWLGINERGDLGNILFFMGKGQSDGFVGKIIGEYLRDSSWPSVESFMSNLTSRKSTYRPFNYLQAAMSPTTGNYSLFYLNNNDTNSYVKLNENEKDTFYFSISNSDPKRPFKKVIEGKELMKNIVREFETSSNKTRLVDRLLHELIQNTTENFPDPNLAAFMNMKDQPDNVRGVSKINADYGSFWENAHTRTSTVILVDHNNNVEYYELNLTSWQNDTNFSIRNKEWVLNSFAFKLKPTYLKTSGAAGSVTRGLISVSTIFAALFSNYIVNSFFIN